MKLSKKWLLGLLSVIAAALVVAIATPARSEVSSSCTFNGISLYGDVQFVSSLADIDVEFVDSFADLNVQFVDSFPDSCGRWRIVESVPDFTVRRVDSFGDITVQEVSSFPGLP